MGIPQAIEPFSNVIEYFPPVEIMNITKAINHKLDIKAARTDKIIKIDKADFRIPVILDY